MFYSSSDHDILEFDHLMSYRSDHDILEFDHLVSYSSDHDILEFGHLVSYRSDHDIHVLECSLLVSHVLIMTRL